MTSRSHSKRLLQIRLAVGLSFLLGLPNQVQSELVTLQIEPQPFPDPSSVSVIVDAGLLGSDEVQSTLSGEIVVELLPTALQPTSAQIVDFRGVVDEAIDFQVGGGFFPRVTVTSDPGEVSVRMVEPGPAATIENGEFTQAGNAVGFAGVVRTSVQPEPIDLGEEAPQVIDLTDIAITQDRHQVTLAGGLQTTVSIPFEVGFLQLNVDIDVDGSLASQGPIPPAVYTLLSSADETSSFGDAAGWLRNGTPATNSLPLADDDVQFTGGASLDAAHLLQLDSTQYAANQVVTEGIVRLRDGQLTTKAIRFEDNSRLTLDATASLEGETIRVEGNGTLEVQGNATSLIIDGGAAVVGAGQFDALTVESEATLLLAPSATMQVQNALTLNEATISLQTEGELVEIGRKTIALAGQLLVDSPQILINDTLQEASPLLLDPTRGVFGLLEINPGNAANSSIVLFSSQAEPGDSDGSGSVDFSDFLTLSATFGQMGDWSQGDFDGNQFVDFADFLLLSANFGSTTIAVPEPMSKSFSAFAALLVGIRLRRRTTRR